ncbi:MAG: hypothetical protein KDK70_23140, partial [Myxococcales bacterium]|nr:hypothetical protein [Myxococcales bacterium]
MHHRIAPLLSALLLTIACDGGQADAKKTDAKKTETKKAETAETKKTETAEAKADDVKGKVEGDAKAGEAGESEEAKKAKEEQERKDRLVKALADLEEWKTKEAARWDEALEGEVQTLVSTEFEDAKAAIAAAVAGKHRHPDNTARDPYRHPAETLAFLGLEPTMTVIEVGPGWGWYTELLAPVLARSGKLEVTTFDPKGPEDQGGTLYARRFEAFAARSEAAYGKIERLLQTPDAPLELGPDGSADMVFIVRGLHGWVNRGQLDANLAKVHAALRPGGIAAVVQHRAKDDAKAEESAKQGYLPQAWVVEKFEGAGFTLEEASEINANPKDTKDYP